MRIYTRMNKRFPSFSIAYIFFFLLKNTNKNKPSCAALLGSRQGKRFGAESAEDFLTII